MSTAEKVLVLGASGGIGNAVANTLRDEHWQVVAMKRGVREETVEGIAWRAGDALNPAEVAAAARGCSVIIHAVNPPGYRDWAKLVVPMIDATLAAARREGALVVLPGTVYNYGPDTFPVLTEQAAQRPLTRKGAIRVELEQRLAAFAEDGGRVLIVRAGDFFGPRAANNWFSQGLIKPGRPVRQIALPGRAGVGHQWAYLPDVARTMATLIAQRARLESFARFHMAGHWDADGSAMASAIERIVLRHEGRAVRRVAFPWWLVTLASPWVSTLRELREMRYLWQTPVRLDNTKLRDFLGAEPHTPLETAVEATLRGLGCLS